MEKMTGLKYWCIMKTKKMNENKNSDPKDGVLRFCTLMIKLHSCYATSASIERIFLYLILFGPNCETVCHQKKSREIGPNLPEPQQKFGLNL
jgi:hypothetical protein